MEEEGILGVEHRQRKSLETGTRGSWGKNGKGASAIRGKRSWSGECKVG